MTISKTELGANLRDVQIAVSKLFGLTDEEAGKRVQTPEAPTGISLRTVQNRLAKNEDFIKGLIAWALPLVRKQRDEIEALSKEKYREELEKLRGKILSARLAGLDSDDLALANSVADKVENRLDGTPVNRSEMLASFEHTHTHLIPEESMLRFERLAEKLKLNIPNPLPALPPADQIIDV